MVVEVINIHKDKLTPLEGCYKILQTLRWQPKPTVFIKPNVCAPSKSSTGVTTDPDIIRGIIRYIQNTSNEVKIIVGEGVYKTDYTTTFYGKNKLYNESTWYNFRKTGYIKMALEENVDLIDLNEVGRQEVDWKYGKISLPKLVLDKNISYVNVAKMKTHSQTTYSLCTKNQKGLLDNNGKKLFHKLGIIEPVQELAKLIQPDLCVVDGVIGLEGQGAGELGTSRDFGIIVAGYDIFEADKKCIELMTNANWKLPKLYTYHFWNVHLHTPPSACSACIKSIGKLKYFSKKSRRGLLFFLCHGIFSRLDIITGNTDRLPSNHGYCLFFGKCTWELAKKYNEYPFISGCPPDPKEAVEYLTL